MNRWRVELKIDGELRWLSHLDILSMIERGIRRAKLPIAYSEGYNPHMLISWGPAHPVGLAGDAEYFDADFTGSIKGNWINELNSLLPQGLEIMAARELKEKTPALMAVINRAEYRIMFSKMDADDLEKGIDGILARKELIINRRSPKGDKHVDIRPGIIELKREKNDLLLTATLGQGASAKPQEVAALVAPQAKVDYILRTGMFIENNKDIQKP